jgi:hypothetical protein
VSRILFDAFDGADTVSVASAIGDEWTASASIDEARVWAAAIGDEWTAAGVVTEAIPASVAAELAADFSASAQISSEVTGNITADMTGDWSAVAFVQTGAVFTPPPPGNQRVAVVVHKN